MALSNAESESEVVGLEKGGGGGGGGGGGAAQNILTVWVFYPNILAVWV